MCEMLSGPTEEVGCVCSIACFVMLCVKEGGGSFCGRCLRFILSIFLLVVSYGSLEMDA